MTREEAKNIMEIEHTCILRQDTPDCGRDEYGCGACDLVQNADDVIKAHDVAIKALERQIAEEAAEDFAHDLESGYYKPRREEAQNINRLLDEKEQDEIEERIWKMVKKKIKEEGDKRYQDGFMMGRKYQVDFGGEI